MNISDYLCEEQVIIDLTSTNKEEAIKEVAQTLRNNPHVLDFDQFLRDIYERENFSTTGIGHGIGIPHARTQAVDDIVIAFGKSRAGVEFNSLDRSPVHLIFLLGTPKDRNLSTYLSLLARLTRLLEKDTFRKRLLEASNARAVVDAFKEVEQQ